MFSPGSTCVAVPLTAALALLCTYFQEKGQKVCTYGAVLMRDPNLVGRCMVNITLYFYLIHTSAKYGSFGHNQATNILTGQTPIGIKIIQHRLLCVMPSLRRLFAQLSVD